MGRKRKQRKNPSHYFLIQRGWKMQSTRKKERGKFESRERDSAAVVGRIGQQAGAI
jgi:hypothetical protein